MGQAVSREESWSSKKRPSNEAKEEALAIVLPLRSKIKPERAAWECFRFGSYYFLLDSVYTNGIKFGETPDNLIHDANHFCQRYPPSQFCLGFKKAADDVQERNDVLLYVQHLTQFPNELVAIVAELLPKPPTTVSTSV